MKFSKLTAVPFVLSAVLAVGCTEQHGSHEYPAKHGGQRFELAAHGPQVEASHDEAKSTVKIWVYDAHDNGEALKEAPVLKIADPVTKIVGKGKDDHWTFTHDILNKHHHNLTFSLKIKDKEYSKGWHAPHH